MNRKAHGQRGNILIPVMLIGLTSTLVMGALINRSVYLEQAAVENRLAESRAYWATMGHFRYALSRQRRTGFCIDSTVCDPINYPLYNIKDSDKATALQSYLDEISSLRTFNYPDENSGYRIMISLTGAPDDDPSRHAFSGYLMMSSSYPTTGVSTLPVLSGLAQRFTPYRMRFCTSLTSAYASCGSVSNNNNGGKPTGLYSVRRFLRTQSVS
jgi:hypothetical protein